MTLPDHLAYLLTQALAAAQAAGDLPSITLPSLAVTRPKQSDKGDFSCAVALQINRSVNEALAASGRPTRTPLEIAAIIARHLPDDPCLARVEVAPPGFLNFFLAPAWLAHQVEAIVRQGPAYYHTDLGKGARVQVEFVSANPTGPLHFGGARNAAIGDTLARLLSVCGYVVQREYYINDRGAQVDTFAATLWRRYQQLHGLDVSIPPDGYPGAYMIDYARAIQAEHGDRLLGLSEAEAIPVFRRLGLALVRAELADDLAQMGVFFDEWFSEQSLYDSSVFARVRAILQEQGDLYEKDGALWFRASRYLPKSDRDEVFLRSNGEPGYYASDIAYHYHKFILRGFDWVIDVWAVDHQNQAARMPAMLLALGIDPKRLSIVLYDLVTLKRGGVEVKISKRSGDLITMREVLDEVGADAARFFLLSHSNEARIDFDLDLAVAQNAENPVYYVQYAHARVASILRKAAAQGLSGEEADLSLLTHPAELALLRKMLQLGEVILEAVRHLAPHHLPHYALDLARTFTAFYDACRVISSDPADAELTRARLRLVEAVKITLAHVLGLMGMTAPESM
jgi:arginyl-tRNA synthetase